MNNISLSVLDQFKCIGPDCSLSCCLGGWLIEVDEDSAKNWETVDAIEGDGKLSEYLRVSEFEGQKKYDMLQKEDATCIALDDSKLCKIQAKYGHDMLPATCRDFPRYSWGDDEFEIRTATLSCPEIARLVLVQDVKGKLFESTASNEYAFEPSKSNDVYRSIRYHMSVFLRKIFKQYRVPPNVKLVYLAKILALFHTELEKEGLTHNLVKSLFSNVEQDLLKLTSDFKKNKLHPDPVTAGSYWKTVFSLMRSQDNLYDKIDYDALPLTRLCEMETNEFDHFREINSHIEDLRTNFKEAVGDKYKALFEKYLRASLVNKHLVHYIEPVHLMRVIVPIVICASQIQLIFWILARQNIEFDEDFLMFVISKTERMLGHTKAVEEALHEDSHMLQLDRYAEVLIDVFS
jgi:hypothetical protein